MMFFMTINIIIIIFVTNQFQFVTGRIQFLINQFQSVAGQIQIVTDQIEYVLFEDILFGISPEALIKKKVE